MHRFTNFYLSQLRTRPLLTKSLTCFVVLGAGDMLTQCALERKSLQALDFGRTARFALLGIVYVAPALHLWYNFLATRMPGTAMSAVAQRVALDQFVFSPISLSVFMSTTAYMEGKPWAVSNDLLSPLLANWAVWIPFQFMNFRFVPTQLQVLSNNVMSVFWNAYISYTIHHPK
jgi:hypothetical protein